MIRDLALGASTYGELLQAPEGIPTNLLADRLKRLQAQEIVEKTAYQQRPVRYSYSLTEKGNGLKPVLLELLKWGLAYVPDTRLPDAVLGKINLKSVVRNQSDLD